MSSDISQTPKNKGGRPKSPLVISQLKATKSLKDSALEELHNLNQEITDKKLGVAEILGYIHSSEAATKAIFAASTVRFLQRGMLLSELMAAFEADGSDSRSWTNFYEADVRPVVGISDKSEQLSRTVWHRWLAAQEAGCEPETLIGEVTNINAFSKALKCLVDGEPEPKPTPSAHDKIQKVRKQVGKSIAATSVGINSDDEHYERLVLAVQSALADLEDYVSSSRPSEAVVDTSRSQHYLNIIYGDDAPAEPEEEPVPTSAKERMMQQLKSVNADIPIAV